MCVCVCVCVCMCVCVCNFNYHCPIIVVTLSICYIYKCSNYYGTEVVVFIFISLVSLFNGISTFVGYLMPKPSLLKNSTDSI